MNLVFFFAVVILDLLFRGFCPVCVERMQSNNFMDDTCGVVLFYSSRQIFIWDTIIISCFLFRGFTLHIRWWLLALEWWKAFSFFIVCSLCKLELCGYLWYFSLIEPFFPSYCWRIEFAYLICQIFRKYWCFLVIVISWWYMKSLIISLIVMQFVIVAASELD